MAIIPVGQEPENIKKRMNTLFAKLNEAYPDKVIRSLQKDHKKWAETVTELYRLLGYDSGNSFLQAYGYSVERAAISGRPANDHMAIIEELQRRYPNGSGFRKVNQLIEANPDLASKFRTLNKNANKLFEKSLGDYLKEIGLIGGEASVEDKTEMIARDRQRLEEKIEELKKRYAGKDLPTTVFQLKTENQDLKISSIDAKIRNLMGEQPVEYLRKRGLLKSKEERREERQLQNKEKRITRTAICDPTEGIVLSEDGKTVISFKRKRKPGVKTVIRIPSGVEEIEDNAFLRAEIDKLILPKELKKLGKYTIDHPYGSYGPYDLNPKAIESIEVEPGNKHYSSDETGFYFISNGRKTLLRLLNKGLSTYSAPEDIHVFGNGAFSNCPGLKHIILPEGMEFFNEYVLPNDTQVKDVFISKTVKHLRVKPASGPFSVWNTVFYKIDEGNPHLFRDEDSIYEVLDDGTYKLVTCLYKGKGKTLFLEGASVIGASAFERHENLSQLSLPPSIRIIEESAFAQTSLRSLTIHDGIRRIESKAFFNCNDLRSVQIGSNSIEFIAEDAFQSCGGLYTIRSSGKSRFSYENGRVKMRAASRSHAPGQEGTTYEWMKGKTFVHTGMSAEDEEAFEQLVQANGGIVKSSTVLATDYLVYNANYDHETTKLRRARELRDQGKDIQILTMDGWEALLNGPSEGTEKGEGADSPVTSVSEKQPEKPAAAPRDRFNEFAEEAAQAVTRGSVTRGNEMNKANYDEKSRRVKVRMAFTQWPASPKLIQERVACAETIKVNDPVKITLHGGNYEVTAKDGRSLGEIGYPMSESLAGLYRNFFSIENAVIADITPKSKRKNSKYAVGVVQFDIVERRIPEDMSEEDRRIREEFAYSLEENEAHLNQWIGESPAKRVVLPAVIEGRPVVSVQPDLFSPSIFVEWDALFETIVISEGIKRIEAGAFNRKSPKKIIFPSSVEFISPNVFSSEDGQFHDLDLDPQTIYVAPAGSYAEKFLKEYKPRHYEVKDLMVVNEDGDQAENEKQLLAAFDYKATKNGLIVSFKDEYELRDFKKKSIAIPNTIFGQPVNIVFLGEIPSFVEVLSIPANTKHLQNISFNSYRNYGHALRQIQIAEENSAYWSDGAAIFSKDRKTLLRFMAFRTSQYRIPEGTEELAEKSFEDMKNLEVLILPESLRSIRDRVFSGCRKLADIQGLERVPEIGDNTFSDLSVPFVKKIPVLTVGSTIKKYNKLSEKVVTVPDGITVIGQSAFSGENENDQVEVIHLPSTVRVIESRAFAGRKMLREINIPEGVKEIGEWAFSRCERMESLFIPASVESIALNALPKYSAADGFIDEIKCSFRSIEVDPANTQYCSVNGMLLTKDKTKILFVPYILQKTSVQIPEGIQVLYTDLCARNDTLAEVTLPNSVRKIGSSAFAYCTSLKKIVFPEGLEIIDKNAFSDCTNLRTVVWSQKLKKIKDEAFKNTSLSSLDLPETLEHIGSEAFAETKLKSVTIPKSVRTLGWGAFSCTPEITVFDTIDPCSKNAESGIDTSSGRPNSLVGYVGMGPAWAMWECAANHRWADYTIVVRSAETEEVKYKVWMGADSSQREYYCFLSSAWGHNATFAFEWLDKFFPKIRGNAHKLQVAKYRLENPVRLSDAARDIYESFVKKHS